MANSCLRQSFGFDSKRLRFLYLTTVEPILTYGCSAWISVLNTKAGTKMLRSFQRLATRFITRSVKTAPTEALLVLANLLPLDLQLLKTNRLRYMGNTGDVRFAPSALKVLSNRLPLGFSTPKFPHASMVSLPDQPPSSDRI